MAACAYKAESYKGPFYCGSQKLATLFLIFRRIASSRGALKIVRASFPDEGAHGMDRRCFCMSGLFYALPSTVFASDLLSSLCELASCNLENGDARNFSYASESHSLRRRESISVGSSSNELPILLTFILDIYISHKTKIILVHATHGMLPNGSAFLLVRL